MMAYSNGTDNSLNKCPVYKKGWPENDKFLLHTKNFKPFVYKGKSSCYCPSAGELSVLLRGNPEGDAVVDVSCEASTETEFRGDPSFREKVELKLSTIVDALISIGEHMPHWTQDTKLKLYLSQCSVFSVSQDEPAQVPFLARFYSLPPPLVDNLQRTVQINLWMNTSACSSALHYDANHNLLVLVQGAKTVTLLSPAHTHLLKAYPAYFTSPNHSRLSIRDLNACIAKLQCHDHRRSQESDNNDQADADTVTVLHEGVFRVSLSVGDALFIPEGWWHAVESEQCSYAVNYWFESPCSAFTSDGPAKHMASYLMRIGLHSLVHQDQDTIDTTEEDSDTSSSTKKRKIDSTSRFGCGYSGENPFHSVVQKLLESSENSSGSQSATQHERLCIDFVSVSFEIMAELWLPFAHKNPTEWTSALLALTPPAAHVLLSKWDTLEISINADSCARFKELVADAGKAFLSNDKKPCQSDALSAFFDMIFSPCGDRISEVRQYLLTQQSLSFADTAKKFTSSILNLQLGPAS